MRVSIVLLALALCVGCGNISINFSLPPKLQAESAELTEGYAPMELDDMGNLLLGGEPLPVESHGELLHFGVTAADLDPLPAVWRPPHLASFDGPMITSLYSQSPLAIAGLRPFDGIESVDGEAIDDAAALVEHLSAKQPGESTTFSVMAPDGRCEIIATAVNGVSDATTFSLPFLYSSRTSALETFVEIGPLSLSRYHEQIVSTGGRERGPWSGYLRSVNWRTVLNLVSYKGTSTPEGRSLYSQWRILWFITFGNDLDDDRSSS